MKKFIFLVLAIVLVFGISKISNPQEHFLFDFTCGTNDLLTAPIIRSLSTTFEGFIKPNRTDTINGNFTEYNAYFPVLVVFVQFKDDQGTDVWPNVSDTSGPTYKNTMIATTKSYNTNWWEAYNLNTETLSDYYLQSSRGKMHVIGDVYSIVLDSNASYYRGIGESAMTTEIWKKLNRIYPINWKKYDRWGWDNDNKTFKYERDSIVDFIYKIHKTTGNGVLQDYYGYAGLGGGADFEVDTVNHIKINHGYGVYGSGITAIKNQTKEGVFGTVCHEHAHYIYSWGHMTYAKLSYGVGFDLFNSPYEMIYNGYMTPKVAEFGQTNTLRDYSSRNTGNGEIIKVPITETECFLLANRRKVSHWDRVMLGDTAFYNVFNDWEYGKGLYIYHVFNGIQPPTYTYTVPQDMESADGYFRWDTIGKQSVYMNCWTSEPVWWVFKKSEVLYINDPSSLGTNHFKGDQLSLHHLIGWNPDGSPQGMTVKFGIGKRADNNCLLGTDRLFTNETEYFSNYNNGGTRYDAWNVGYNEVFSPYSSPSTAKHNDDNSGIFIWYKSLNSSTNEASIDIYQVDNPNSLDEILELTPPSRPMGIKTDYHWVSETLCHPKITWVNNTEPDVINPSTGKIRYKLYRAYKLYMNQIPGPPVLIENNLEFYPNETPTYIDYQIIGYQSILSGDEPWLYPVRYWVKVVDNSNDESVFSDFTSAIGINDGSVPIGGSGSDNLISNKNIPKQFALSQNYPNPFNPITNIKYDLPKDIFVSIKIYDMLGREIKTLVNEFKNAGSYVVSFNGSELASGIYFYRIQAGNFASVKRMVLIK